MVYRQTIHQPGFTARWDPVFTDERVIALQRKREEERKKECLTPREES